MIVATTQDLEEIGNCGCPCDVFTHPPPRIASNSISVVLCAVKPGDSDYPPSSQEGVAAEEDDILYPAWTWALTGHKVYDDQEYTSAENGTWTADPVVRTTGTTCGRNVGAIASYTAESWYDSGTKAHKMSRDTDTWTLSADDSTEMWHSSGHITQWEYDGTVFQDNDYESTFEFHGPDYGGINDPIWTITGSSAVLNFRPDEVVIVGSAGVSGTFSYSGAYTSSSASAAIAGAFAVIPVWPDDELKSILIVTLAADANRIKSAEATQAKFRIAPPYGFSTTTHPRSVFEAQWDIGFFPDGWDAMIDDPEITPPDPLPEDWTHPQIPDPDASPPVRLSSHTWIWDGDSEDPWSDEYIIPIPTAGGTNERVNLMTKSYHSARYGVKPTAHGKQYVFPDPP